MVHYLVFGTNNTATKSVQSSENGMDSLQVSEQRKGPLWEYEDSMHPKRQEVMYVWKLSW